MTLTKKSVKYHVEAPYRMELALRTELPDRWIELLSDDPVEQKRLKKKFALERQHLRERAKLRRKQLKELEELDKLEENREKKRNL